ncbi:hypothetical protein Patl1_29266 [Pistacia atlantica]|uniref:Uncharacterized protein n=1 Tax=Pistacia atlantica TaxID=434234 RepID=A0ACC1BBY4_9ROSI|nr:hypothetical protein Patl1_29266 [Pistacia atlantica]
MLQRRKSFTETSRPQIYCLMGTTMRKYQILAWRNWGLLVESPMSQRGLWAHMVMLLQNILQRVFKWTILSHLYVKSDVYGFGVVLLEMLTGLRALDTKRPTGEQNLVEWMKPMLSQKKKLKTIMDARIEGQYSTKAAQQAAQLALKCLEADPKHRPSMKEVVETLERVEAIKEKPKKVFSSSRPTTKHGAQPPSHLRSPLHSKHRVKT